MKSKVPPLKKLEGNKSNKRIKRVEALKNKNINKNNIKITINNERKVKRKRIPKTQTRQQPYQQPYQQPQYIPPPSIVVNPPAQLDYDKLAQNYLAKETVNVTNPEGNLLHRQAIMTSAPPQETQTSLRQQPLLENNVALLENQFITPSSNSSKNVLPIGFDDNITPVKEMVVSSKQAHISEKVKTSEPLAPFSDNIKITTKIEKQPVRVFIQELKNTSLANEKISSENLRRYNTYMRMYNKSQASNLKRDKAIENLNKLLNSTLV